MPKKAQDSEGVWASSITHTGSPVYKQQQQYVENICRACIKGMDVEQCVEHVCRAERKWVLALQAELLIGTTH